MAKSFTFLSLELTLHAVILHHHPYQFLYDPLPPYLYQLPNPDRKRPNSKKLLFYPVTGLIRPYNKIYTFFAYPLGGPRKENLYIFYLGTSLSLSTQSLQ